MFFTRSKKCFPSEREQKKALRDILTRAAWLGPSNFLLVRSEHAHASYPGLFFLLSSFFSIFFLFFFSSFARLGSAPIWGGKKGEFRDWTSVFFVRMFVTS